MEDCLILNLYLPPENSSSSSSSSGSSSSSSSSSSISSRPILLWIFGGDNTASEIIPYNATKLAGEHGAVVAVVSYRLGLFGFAAFEEDLAAGGSTGNAGLQDILAAADWLRREAPALGADPDRLIVFGESSGATDAQILTMVGAARTRVAGSIAESGGLYATDLAEALENTRAVAAAVGCCLDDETTTATTSMKACMASKPADLLVEAVGNQSSGWGPTVDGVFLTKQPAELLLAGAGGLHPGASVLWGGNTNDSANPYNLQMKLGREQYIRELNETIRHGGHGGQGGHGADYAAQRRGGRRRRQRRRHFERLRRAWSVFGGHRRRRASSSSSASDLSLEADRLLRRALELYPPRDDERNGPNVGWFQSDQFLCGQRRELQAAAQAASGGGKAFLYRFDWLFQSTTTCVADSNYHDPRSGSNHCDEMSFVYGQPIFDNQDPPGYSYTNCSDPRSVYYDKDRCVGCAFDAAEAALSRAMGRFWTTFAAGGAPRGAPRGGAGVWPAFTPSSAPLNVVLHPDAIVTERDMGRPAACAFWDTVAGSLAG